MESTIFLSHAGTGCTRLTTAHIALIDGEKPWYFKEKRITSTLQASTDRMDTIYTTSKIAPLFPEQEMISENTNTPKSNEKFSNEPTNIYKK